MPEYFSFPSFQDTGVQAEWTEKRSFDVSHAAPFISTSAPGIVTSSPSSRSAITTEQLPFPSQLPRTTQTLDERPVLTTGPIYDATTTQSLVAALQSTIYQTEARPRVVIPAARKRKQTTEELLAQKRLHPRLRFAIVMVVLLIVILTTLISLSPLNSGQNGSYIFNDVIGWAQAQQQNWSIVAHLDGTNPVQATTPGMPAADPMQGAAPPITLPQSQYVAIARQDAISAGINPDYFVRQIFVESGFNPNAASGAGAVGIAQFIPGTAATLGVNPYDPISALKGAATLMATYSNQYNGDYAKALAAYNAGSGTVDYAVRMGGANWMNYLPFETRNYIYKIIGV